MQTNARRRCVLLLMFAGLTACSNGALDETPVEIQGTWITDAPSYTGRAFTIEPNSLTLFRGEGDKVTHALDRIEFIEQDAKHLYRLHHHDVSGAMDMLEVAYVDSDGEWLRLTNLPRVGWYRDTTGVVEALY